MLTSAHTLSVSRSYSGYVFTADVDPGPRSSELFRQDIKLNSHTDLERFLENVPRAYCRHIEHLDLGTEGGKRSHADALISLLLASPRLSQLVLRLQGSLDQSVISCFGFLANLRHLTIRNTAEEVILPL